MLMKHKNFRFTKIPDKTNDVIFLKSSNIMFWGHFWKIRLCHTQLYMGPNAMLSFRKNQWADPEKTYRQTEGQTDGPYIIAPFQLRPGVQKKLKGYEWMEKRWLCHSLSLIQCTQKKPIIFPYVLDNLKQRLISSAKSYKYVNKFIG